MLITNGRIVTWGNPNRLIDNGAVRIIGGIIGDLGTTLELKQKYPDETIEDAAGALVMPGNICAHTHFYGAFSRGMAIPGNPARNFPEILDKLWWPLDKALDTGDVRASAQVCLIDAIRHGTTTLFDHHASQSAISGSLAEIAAVADEAGLRTVLCYEVTDRDGRERMQEGVRENTDFIETVKRTNPGNGRIKAAFGLHASLTLSEQTLDEVRSAAPDDAGFHLHVAEHSVDEYDSLDRHGMRIVERLEKHRLLNPNSILAHCVHIDAHEMELVKQSGAWITHQPRSNMNNGVGVAPVESMTAMGIPVCLGNDGFSNAMWEEWKTAYLLHKAWNMDPRRMPGDLVLKLAVEHNRQLAKQYFDQPLGIIEPGASADLILVEYQPFTELTAGNIPWHILFGFRDSMVKATMVAGKWLMKDRLILTMDEEKMCADALQRSGKTWERYAKRMKQG